MLITTEQMQALTTGFRADFEAGKSMVASQFTELSTSIPSTSATNTYGWLGEFPNMREWVGDRVLNELSTHSYTIANRRFESTVSVKRDDIEDDNIGIYKPMMQELGRLLTIHPDQLIFALLANGITELCYDGLPFFSAKHLVGEENVSNFDTATNGVPWYLLDCSRPLKPLIYQERKKGKLTTMTKDDDEESFMRGNFRYGVDNRCNVGFGFWQMAHCSQKPLTEANFNASVVAMRNLLNEAGNPLGINPTHIVVPPSLHSTALGLMAQTRANGASNPLFKRVEIIESDWLIAKPKANTETEGTPEA